MDKDYRVYRITMQDIPFCPTCQGQMRFHRQIDNHTEYRCPSCYGGDESPNNARVIVDEFGVVQPPRDKATVADSKPGLGGM